VLAFLRGLETSGGLAADCAAYNDVADQVMADAGIPAIDLYGFTRQLWRTALQKAHFLALTA